MANAAIRNSRMMHHSGNQIIPGAIQDVECRKPIA
jgi:hypothetical protein